MDDMKELIGSFSGMISELKDQIADLNNKFEEIMTGANDAYADWDHNNKKTAFSERNKDFLDKYSDKLKAIEGDDFDLAEEAMKVPEGADEAEYIASLAASIDDQLGKLKEALGVEEVVAEKQEETEITADSEPVAEITSEVEKEETTPEKSEDELLAEEVEKEKNKDRSLK